MRRIYDAVKAHRTDFGLIHAPHFTEISTFFDFHVAFALSSPPRPSSMRRDYQTTHKASVTRFRRRILRYFGSIAARHSHALRRAKYFFADYIEAPVSSDQLVDSFCLKNSGYASARAHTAASCAPLDGGFAITHLLRYFDPTCHRDRMAAAPAAGISPQRALMI